MSRNIKNIDINLVTPVGKVREAYMGPTWGRQDPGGPHVGTMNLVIRDVYVASSWHVSSCQTGKNAFGINENHGCWRLGVARSQCLPPTPTNGVDLITLEYSSFLGMDHLLPSWQNIGWNRYQPRRMYYEDLNTVHPQICVVYRSISVPPLYIIFQN